MRLLRVLTVCGSEYCGNLEHHEYELFLALEDINHTKTKAKVPQMNGICERFHQSLTLKKDAKRSYLPNLRSPLE